MIIYLSISIFLSIFYAVLITTYVIGWHRLPYWKKTAKAPETSVAVIIPARNEAHFIEACLLAILHQNYPKELLEIIVIDDHSTDETPDIIANLQKKHPQIQLIRLADVLPDNAILTAYKKKAIEIAINQTQQELIITTDADCLMLPNWIGTMVNYYESHPCQLLAAPVCFIGETTFFQRFQTLDFFGMIISTGASIHFKASNMCNGANLAYSRAAFYEVDGFRGIDDIPSGDDMLLMAKIAKKYPSQIHFVKSQAATVYTYPQPDVATFTAQRLRWASKSTKYDDKRITFFLGSVYLFNLSIPITFLLACFLNPSFWLLFAFQFGLKCFVDFLYLGTGCDFFKRNELLWLFLPCQPVHLLYIIVIGALGNFGKYEWKGRKVE